MNMFLDRFPILRIFKFSVAIANYFSDLGSYQNLGKAYNNLYYSKQNSNLKHIKASYIIKLL